MTEADEPESLRNEATSRSTARIVQAFVARNSLFASDVLSLIQAVYASLRACLRRRAWIMASV